MRAALVVPLASSTCAIAVLDVLSDGFIGFVLGACECARFNSESSKDGLIDRLTTTAVAGLAAEGRS